MDSVAMGTTLCSQALFLFQFCTARLAADRLLQTKRNVLASTSLIHKYIQYMHMHKHKTLRATVAVHVGSTGCRLTHATFPHFAFFYNLLLVLKFLSYRLKQFLKTLCNAFALFIHEHPSRTTICSSLISSHVTKAFYLTGKVTKCHEKEKFMLC